MTPRIERYLLVIWEDLEPQIFGPFDSEKDRGQRADRARGGRAYDPVKHGIYLLDIVNGRPEVRTYSG